MTAPLEGTLVVSIEQAVAAPYCSSRLREAGARVIKIERPGGDFARGYDSIAGGDSSYFFWLNQGKESLVMDFKQPEDAALLHRILAESDVLIQNLAPGALARAGFDLSTLRDQYPKLITCDISGYGHGQAVAGLKAYDFLVQAESGLVSISGGKSELGRIGISACDIGAGMTAHSGILEALLQRSRTGAGSAVEVSLFGVAADWMTVPLLHHDYGGKAPSRAGLHHPSIAPYGGYSVKGGEIVIIAIQNEREWQRFCERVLKQPEQSKSAEFCSNNQRVSNRPALDAMINSITGTLDRNELIERLQNADVAFGSVNSVEDFSNHPALQRREGKSSSGVAVMYPMRPVGMPENMACAPEIGQHSDALRQEFS
ncbi:MAG: CaiB/BaiF CoA transferase family protein [bacterium]